MCVGTCLCMFFFFFKQKTAYEMRISDWSSDVCSSDLTIRFEHRFPRSPKFHRLHFAMLGAIFDNQEQFPTLDDLRYWLEVGAGHCNFVPAIGRASCRERVCQYV